MSATRPRVKRRQVLVLVTNRYDFEAPLVGSEVRGKLYLPDPSEYRNPATALHHGWRLLAPPNQNPLVAGEWEWWFEREEPARPSQECERCHGEGTEVIPHPKGRLLAACQACGGRRNG